MIRIMDEMHKYTRHNTYIYVYVCIHMLICYSNLIADQGGWSGVSLHTRPSLSNKTEALVCVCVCACVVESGKLSRTCTERIICNRMSIYVDIKCFHYSQQSSIAYTQPTKPTHGLFNPGTGSRLSMLRFYQTGFRWGFVFQYVVTKRGFGCLG